jgi:nicotinate-nucleotide pyrophosphorylase
MAIPDCKSHRLFEPETAAGPARGMLTAERVALNFLGHLSGVATAMSIGLGPAIAASGVDLISADWLTHSAQVLDIGLDWRRASAGAERSAA